MWLLFEFYLSTDIDNISVFKEQLHQSFSEYVLSVRMREAKRLMEEDPAIKIKEVAELVGYESVYTFSRAYKQYYHVSPKQDRDG